MRYYNVDGTYTDHPYDTEFGWFCENIIIDEAIPSFVQQNEEIMNVSRMRRKWWRTWKSNESNESKSTSNFKQIEESVDALEKPNESPIKILKVDFNIKEETPNSTKSCLNSVEGLIENPHSYFKNFVRNYEIPTKEGMLALINPVNPESKALLGVISYTRYTKLNDRAITENVIKTINFKTTNFKYFLGEFNFPRINFQLSGNTVVDVDKQIAKEIQNYHSTKEDNKLSLMMELINTDLDSNLGDMSEINSLNGYVETSDLGNSIQSSILSKEGSSIIIKEQKRSFLEVPNRANILSSLGLNDDIDKSIENFEKEKSEMRKQLSDIKKSFEADEKKLDSLMSEVSALKTDLKETVYLNNLLHLLNGKPEKVKDKKLPFRIFHPLSIGHEEVDMNFII